MNEIAHRSIRTTADGVTVHLLGAVRAAADGVDVDLGGPKEKAVLALLAVDSSSAGSPEALIDAIWDDRPPASARKTLQTYVAHLRRSFEAVGATEVIRTDRGGYSMSAAVRTDVDHVEALMAAAQRTGVDNASRAAMLGEALECFGGQPFVDAAPSDRLSALAESYRQVRWNLIDQLARARVDTDDPALIADVYRWIDEHPLHEGLWASLMLALYRSGRQTDALATFQRARDRLVDLAGLEPGPELRDLELAILRHDPKLLERASARAVGSVSETVTFLFTDGERSTVLWDLDQTAMCSALEIHDELVRSCIERHHGRVFAVTGDGFGAAFGRADDAAHAAVDIQDELRRVDWPTSEPFRVRIGLHAGTAELRGGNYFGAAVNRAARVMSKAHGGQVLCSNSAAALLADLDHADGSLHLLGEYPLKGLHRPEMLHQFIPPGSSDTFPPIERDAGPSPTLPIALDSLHGRSRELSDVSGLVADHRLVTLTGAGGTGKTRLALEMARQVYEEFRDGVIWVELSSVDVDGVVGAVAAAVGARLSGPTVEHTSQVTIALERREALLVLDNCEHLLGAAADFIGNTLHTCRKLRILTTSREPVGVAGERIYVVPSLELPGGPELSASEELLRARAESAGATLASDRAIDLAVRDLCRRLDGVPLALEFAGAQLAVFSPSELLDRLEDHFRFLGRPGVAAIGRQQTMDQTIDWSYQLLDDDEQRLLRRLGIFRDGFDAAAAGAVASPNEDSGPASAVLDRLTWKSLIAVTRLEGRTRFKLLEPVRQFALARLRDSSEVDEALSAHGRHFHELLRRPPSGDRFRDEGRRLAIVAGDLANIRLASQTLAIQDATACLQLFDGLRSSFGFDLEQVHQTVRRLLADSSELDPLVEGHAANTLGTFETYASPRSALRFMERAMEIAASTGDPTLRAETEYHLGARAFARGELDEAVGRLATSTALHDELGNEATLAINLAWYGLTLALAGRADEALELSRRASHLGRLHGLDTELIAPFHVFVAARAGDTATTTQLLEDLAAEHVLFNLAWPPVLAAVETLDTEHALALAAALLTKPDRSTMPDPVFAHAVAVVCHRCGESELGALWVAASRAHQELLELRAGEPLPDRVAVATRHGAGGNDVDALIRHARTLLGDRLDELIHQYRDTPWSLARETSSVLQSQLKTTTTGTE